MNTPNGVFKDMLVGQQLIWMSVAVLIVCLWLRPPIGGALGIVFSFPRGKFSSSSPVGDDLELMMLTFLFPNPLSGISWRIQCCHWVYLGIPPQNFVPAIPYRGCYGEWSVGTLFLHPIKGGFRYGTEIL